MGKLRFLAALIVGAATLALVSGATGWAALSRAGEPETTITLAPPDPSASADASFEFSSDDASATFQCSLDDALPLVDCVSPQNYTGLTEVSHTFEVVATGAAGTDPSPAVHTWTIDLTAPDTAVDSTSTPPDPSPTSDASFSFSSNEDGTFQCALDGVPEDCVSPKAYADLTEGSHTFEVAAVDAAGNIDASPASYTWTVDTPPETTIDSAPPDPSNSADASFTFSSDELPSTFQCALDGDTPIDCSTGQQDYSGLGEGSHTFEVVAADSTPNTDPTPATYTWTVDLTPPDTLIDAAPADPAADAAASFEFSSPEAGSTFQCSLDGAPLADCASPQTYPGPLAEGSHTFNVVATDAAGNADLTPASDSWRVDTTKTAPVGHARARARHHRVMLHWVNPADPDFRRVKVIRNGTVVATKRRGRFVDDNVQSGWRYKYTIVAYDKAGNASDPVIRQVRFGRLLNPRESARVSRPPLLRWRGRERATYYNVQLWRHRVKILSAWPSGERLQLRRSWTFEGKRYELRPGRYRWYVWPGYGSRAESRYGGRLGSSSFRST
jgi:hypothetical protein